MRLVFELQLGLLKTDNVLPLSLLSQMAIERTLGPTSQAFAEATTHWYLSGGPLLATCLQLGSSITQQYHNRLGAGNEHGPASCVNYSY